MIDTSSDPGPPPPPPTLGVFHDSTPPVGHLSAKWKRTGVIALAMDCDEECTAIAAGVVVSNRSRVTLTTTKAEIAGGATVIVKLRPKGRKARRMLRNLVAGSAGANAKISVTFTDRAGNSTIEKLVLKLKR